MNSKAVTETKKSISLIFCSFFPVGLEDYVIFLQRHFSNLIYIKWKFPHSKDKKAYSSREIYRNGKIFKKTRLFSFSVAGTKAYFVLLPINYLLYLCQALNLLFVRRDKARKVVFMGINYYCAFCGILLKKLGRVDHVIYRVMDFFPLPSKGAYRFLTKVFYKIDKYCLDRSDFIWFTTEGHIIGREKYGYFDRKKSKYAIIPLGINIDKIVATPLNKKNQHSLVYCGVVNRYHLLDLVFEAIERLKGSFPDLIFNVIGDGPDLPYYKNLSKEKHLDKNVIFYGYMEENDKFYKTISNNALGIALYRDEENLMKYTEPAKVKYYLNFGVPALISKVPQIAFELDKRKVSFAVDNNVPSLVKTIEKYFSSPEIRSLYQKNLSKYLEEVDIEKLLKAKFDELEKMIV
jgi:glycosyltransferase involved in cell wall biosynthesis